MKTTIFNTTKSIFRMQATILLIAILITLSYNTNAQQEDYILNSLAYNEIISETDSKIMAHIFKASVFENELELTEETFEFEEWMMDLAEWKTASSNEGVLDKELELANWMICLGEWAYKLDIDDRENDASPKASADNMSKTVNSNSEEYLDESLILEDWMMELSDWDMIKYDNIAESELELEDWMTNPAEWK